MGNPWFVWLRVLLRLCSTGVPPRGRLPVNDEARALSKRVLAFCLVSKLQVYLITPTVPSCCDWFSRESRLALPNAFALLVIADRHAVVDVLVYFWPGPLL